LDHRKTLQKSPSLLADGAPGEEERRQQTLNKGHRRRKERSKQHQPVRNGREAPVHLEVGGDPLYHVRMNLEPSQTGSSVKFPVHQLGSPTLQKLNVVERKPALRKLVQAEAAQSANVLLATFPTQSLLNLPHRRSVSSVGLTQINQHHMLCARAISRELALPS
jgi:hypothetical protein